MRRAHTLLVDVAVLVLVLVVHDGAEDAGEHVTAATARGLVVVATAATSYRKEIISIVHCKE